ncbi:MAG: hypothetical protein J5980_01595 [Muribaculaceae bacterium]|nr:hypothetical protein [Muribaculaceae bacterium]MBO6250315.1 hypothetical protein [Muribaculaceae bacterium]
MNLSISQTELDAICFAISQIEGEIESADDDFVHDASVHLNALYGICKKYKKARQKDEIFRLAKKSVKNYNKNLSDSEVSRLARLIVKK